MKQAFEKGDLKALLAIAGPDLQAEAARHFAGMSDREMQTELAGEAAHLTNEVGFRIINKQVVAPDQVVLTYYIDGQDGYGMMPFRQTADGWQISGKPPGQ